MFGPVFTLFHARDENHAIEIANQGSFGLGASIHTQNRVHGEKLIDQVRSGISFINQIPKAEALIPTGGVGKSGYGREGGLAGFHEFANVRTYYVN